MGVQLGNRMANYNNESYSEENFHANTYRGNKPRGSGGRRLGAGFKWIKSFIIVTDLMILKIILRYKAYISNIWMGNS